MERIFETKPRRRKAKVKRSFGGEWDRQSGEEQTGTARTKRKRRKRNKGDTKSEKRRSRLFLFQRDRCTPLFWRCRPANVQSNLAERNRDIPPHSSSASKLSARFFLVLFRSLFSHASLRFCSMSPCDVLRFSTLSHVYENYIMHRLTFLVDIISGDFQ